MQHDVLRLLCCPLCSEPLTWTIADELDDQVRAAQGSCAGGHGYEIREGIAVLLPGGAEDPWEESVSGMERMLQAQPAVEEAMFAPDPSGLGPADRFLRVQLLQARGRFMEAEQEYAAAVAGIYGPVFAAAMASNVESAAARLAAGEGPILDVASGPGTLVRELLRQTQRTVIATDVSAWVLRRLREQVKALGLQADRLALVVCDARRLPFQDGSIPDLTTFEGILNIAVAAAVEGSLPRSAARALLAEWRRVAQRMVSVQTLFSPWDVLHRAILGRYGVVPLTFARPFHVLLDEAGWRVAAETGRTLTRRPTPRSTLLPGVTIDQLPVAPTRVHLECLVASAAPGA